MKTSEMEGGSHLGAMAKSLLVPSVKEVVAKQVLANKAIPSRYIRYEASDPPPVSCNDNDLQVPIINMEALLAGDLPELEKFHRASKDWGFFQVVKHGVSGSLIGRMKCEVEELFGLPMEEKAKYWQTPGDIEGFGQGFVVSEEQKLDWADAFYLTTLPPAHRKPHLFPLLPLPFRDTLESFSVAMQKLAMEILECLGQALGADAGQELRELFEDGKQGIRMSYYPPCPQSDKVIGLSPHSDAGGLTILLQINEMEGLQIRKNGTWVTVNPLPDAFVVNFGDILEIVSNGVYHSIEHRVVINPSKERLSVAAFHSPSFDKHIGPLPCLTSSEQPARFQSIKMEDYLKGYFARKLDGKSYVDSMRINHKTDMGV